MSFMCKTIKATVSYSDDEQRSFTRVHVVNDCPYDEGVALLEQMVEAVEGTEKVRALSIQISHTLAI